METAVSNLPDDVEALKALVVAMPRGGGGASGSVRRVLAFASTLIPGDCVRPTVNILVA